MPTARWSPAGSSRPRPTVWVAWARTDQGAGTLAAWAAAPAAETRALGSSNKLDLVAARIDGLAADTVYAFRFTGPTRTAAPGPAPAAS